MNEDATNKMNKRRDASSNRVSVPDKEQRSLHKLHLDEAQINYYLKDELKPSRKKQEV